MKQITYEFSNRGCYLPDSATKFDSDTHMKLVVKPHSFRLELSGEVLRSSSCSGYTAVVSHKGEVHFYDADDALIATAQETDREYREVRLQWQQNALTLCFGQVETVDHYPNCDGEHDRWGTQWVAQHTVTLDLQDHTLRIG